MTRHASVFAALLLALISGCTGSQADVASHASADEPAVAAKAQERPSAEEIALNYGRMRLMTKEPVLVDPVLAAFCVGIRQQQVDDSRKRFGPHAHTSIRIFMNDAAAGALRKSTAYPVGSVIVKEKQGLEYQAADASSQGSAKTRDGVGGMIKRAAGYDENHGNWEYFYFEEPSNVERGKISSCIECHRGAAALDYVFGSWAEGD